MPRRNPNPDPLDEELEHHLETLIAERIALGDTEEQATRFALAKIGNRTALKETVHEISRLHLLEAATRHTRFAFRTLLRKKSAYLSAAGILALGIGMSVAMFSLVDAVLLRPLPFPNQNAISVIWKADPLTGSQVEELAYPELRDLQENVGDFQYVAIMPTSLYGYARTLQIGGRDPVQIESTPVSHDFFRVLGVAPILGRDFNASDEHVGAPPVVILSDRVWREELGADAGIVGHMLRLNGQGHTVIGVMAPGVEFPRGAGLWVPLGVDAGIVEHRGATFLQAIARARPGTQPDRIAAQVDALFQRLAVDHPDVYTRSQRGVVMPLVQYWTGSARPHLWIMLAASLLLLIASMISACNLLLSRTLSRRSEIATRLALGARRGQILAQLGAESALVAIFAAAAGLGVAQLVTQFLVQMAPADIPRLAEAALNLNSFCFAAGAASLAAIACTVIPGWSAAKMHLETALREGGVRLSSSRHSGRTRNVFILSQAAVTVVMLVMALLLLVSYRSMMAADVGFANRDAVSMNLQLRGPGVLAGRGVSIQTRRAFYQRLLTRLRESPRVTSAAAVLVRPLEGPIGWDVSYEFEFEAGTNNRRVAPKTNYEVVTPDYFKTVGTPLLEGRDFSQHDSEDGEPVAIISQALAQRIRAAGFFPLGHRIRLGSSPQGGKKIIGVAADARYRNITQKGADIFVPSAQANPPTNYVVIRGTQSAQELSALVRRLLNEIDPTQAIAGVATIGELIDRNAARHRFNMILLLWFAICAAILAATGVFSVIAESMAAREREIAIRTALGAQRPRLVRQMVARTLGFVVIGEAFGLCAATILGTLASDLLYTVSPRDPVILATVGAFLFVVSSLAAFAPAWSAAGRIDAKSSLRVS
ncbi:MAG: ADOP family duplicated permease [Bryobacteraceae bacterium]